MTAKKSNTRPVATNYPLIFIILIITTAASLGLYFIALKKTGISGISWLSSACLWALLNSFITYRDSVFRQDNFFKTTFFTILESVQLLFLTSALLFFFNYNILIGLPILFIYSLFKMLKSTHPFFQLTEKVIYSNRDAIRQLGKKGAWVTDEIIEIAGEIKLREISSQVPVPAAIEPVRTPLPPGPPKKLKINIPIPPEMDNEAPQDKNLQETNETTSTKKVEDIYMKSIDQQKKEIIRDEWILEKLRDIFGFKEEEEITENYQEISKRLSDLLFNSEYVDYQIPEELSASGLDDIPKSEGKSDLIQMDIRKRIQILLFLALNDMSRIFRMKIIDPVEVRIVFPWENTEEEKKEKKLTEKLKTELGWIISITGALREDFTYALLAANLVDIWFDENAQEEVSSYKKGFHFWVAYKLLKYRKYYTAAHNAKRQHYQKFKEIRNIERLYGEHGVFYFILKNDYPGPSPEELEIERIQKTKDIEPPSARREFLTIEKHFEAKIAAVTLSSLQEEDAKTEILDRARISRLMEDKTSVELGKELREMNKEEQEAEAEDVKKEEIDETATVIEVSEEEAIEKAESVEEEIEEVAVDGEEKEEIDETATVIEVSQEEAIEKVESVEEEIEEVAVDTEEIEEVELVEESRIDEEKGVEEEVTTPDSIVKKEGAPSYLPLEKADEIKDEIMEEEVEKKPFLKPDGKMLKMETGLKVEKSIEKKEESSRKTGRMISLKTGEIEDRG